MPKKKEEETKELKIKDLQKGMNDVTIDVEIDFVGEKKRAGYGESLFLPAYVKDETGEIKMTFWEDDVAKAKPKKKVRIKKGYISMFRGELQLNANKEIGVEFL